MNKTGWAVVLAVGALLVIMLVVAPFAGVAAGRGYGWGMMGPGMMSGWGFPFMGGLGMLLFWLLIIGGVVWLVQSAARGAAGSSGMSAPTAESSLDILKHRYARGEITKEQFAEMRQTLGA